MFSKLRYPKTLVDSLFKLLKYSKALYNMYKKINNNNKKKKKKKEKKKKKNGNKI